jgi:hypothetical protein
MCKLFTLEGRQHDENFYISYFFINQTFDVFYYKLLTYFKSLLFTNVNQFALILILLEILDFSSIFDRLT